MAGTPSFAAARSGVLGDPGAIDTSASINQLLGAHPATTVYTGSEILTPTGSGGAPLSLNLGAADWDQPFTMSGTAIGRVVIPVAPVGAGADLTVALCNDSSGSPGSVIVSTRVAAKVLAALVATASLAAGSAPPLATAASNSLTASSSGQFVSWAAPAVSIQGGGSTAGVITAGSNILLVGGQDQSNNPVANVFSIAYAGGTSLAAPVAQPSIPQALAYPGVAATPDTLVVASGILPGTTTAGTASVFTASLNTATGAVGAWSTQTSLPQALQQATVVASGQTVYVIGGLNNSSQSQRTVYYATVQNGQITGWNTGTPFPTATNNSASVAAVVNGFLVVTNQVGTNNFDVVYAPINADGSIGVWQSGPSLPYNVALAMAPVPGVGVVIQAIGSGPTVSAIMTLTVGPNGVGPLVQVQKTGNIAAAPPSTLSLFPSGTGTWQMFSLYNSQYWTQSLGLVPAVSVALPASGLTNSGTYHVVLSQQGGDAADYLLAGTDQAVFPGSPTATSRARSGGSSWTATTPAGTAIPIQLFDQTAGGQPLHTWVDSGLRHGTLIYATTPDKRLLGVIEQTQQPGPVLNAAATFTAGLGPWTVAGGSGTTSSAHVHGSLPLSAQITPSGSAATAGIESEQQPVWQGHTYQASAWAYSAVGYANAAVNIRWYNGGGLMATTAGTVTALPAGTWTLLSVSGAVPAGALYGTVQVVESGTPPATAVFWVSAAPLQDASGPMLPSIAQLVYAGLWPSAGVWPPLGVNQLA